MKRSKDNDVIAAVALPSILQNCSSLQFFVANVHLDTDYECLGF